ncbi:hypothetical protein [Lachnoclostridium sp. An76]|uniref:hypothetical protein n=1 Tax=Lachnoclostridium sp. An76 TaxID=1965654 RepID=UPI000B3706DB|nr:hypothetical protein [Lachnoclostridium sp. An76]OUN33814.1 hypothetical protein B5G27_09980 [Lachnoclostridium sp. An76]
MKKLEIRNYALKAAGGLSEPKASCSLLLSAFSIVPDFLVFAATEPRSRSHPHTRAEYVFDKHASLFSNVIFTRKAPPQIQIFKLEGFGLLCYYVYNTLQKG